MKSLAIIGLMSGTSMDGLDISYCRYLKTKNNKWTFESVGFQTVKYPTPLLIRLKTSTSCKSEELIRLDKDIAIFFSKAVNLFVSEHNLDRSKLVAIASHGHTVFHQPEIGVTMQIGCGETLAYNTGIKVINDFRQKDVCAGGQGAPLVPIGDLLLFSDKADAFLNIGGFCNGTFIDDEIRAYDFCPGNLPLNRIVNNLGLSYDTGGKLSSQGNIDNKILHSLNKLSYYSKLAPKSLGTEWLDDCFMPKLLKIKDPKDQLRTCVEHIALQISSELNQNNIKTVMISGGGCYNDFLIERIRQLTNASVIIPPSEIIEFKEAIVFGFLGALYLEGIPNVLSSVTGASKNVIAGVLHVP